VVALEVRAEHFVQCEFKAVEDGGAYLFVKVLVGARVGAEQARVDQRRLLQLLRTCVRAETACVCAATHF